MTTQQHYNNAVTLLRHLKNKTISSVELTQQAIERIKALNPKLNAVVVYDFEAALQEAKKADALIALGQWMPLLGLPMTVKESFSTKDFPTTWGNPELKDFYPQEDGISIERLKNAGAIIIGKSNIPFMLKDWQTKNPVYGQTYNPWDITRTPGGSSGGSAVALASGMVSLELGSDLAGSLRAPAHFCGIYSHRPSSNLVPLRGSGFPLSPSTPGRELIFPVSGPMARSAVDLRLMLDVLAGPDPLWQGRGYDLNLKVSAKTKLKDYKVLAIKSHPLCPVSDVVAQAFNQRIAQLKLDGCNVHEYDPKTMLDLAAITRNYVTLFASYGSAGTSDEEYNKVLQMCAKLPKGEDSLGACVLKGWALTQRDFLRLQMVRETLRGEFIKLFKDYDLILTPVMPTQAFKNDFSDIAQRQLDVDGTLYPYSIQYSFVSLVTNFGLPATIAPVQTQVGELPVGMQIIGNFLDDYDTIQFACLMEQAYGGFLPPPVD